MPRISRIVAINYPHHITQRGVRSITIFSSDNDRNQYLQFIKEESERHDLEILAWCLMSNHVHFVAIPHTEESLSRGFGEAHKRYTRMKNFKDNVRGYLFQGRFGSCVLDERHLVAAVSYVENNPVAAGMVKHSWQYKWSSAAYHVGDVKKDVLVKSKNLYGLVKDWRTYLTERIDGKDEIDHVRKATKTGRPAGNQDFVKKIEKLTGRLIQRKKPGPKKKRG
ncbi:MAG: transposase [Deltaproteobacteria bacterium HGW-Deltaproteobacteria-13]|nr:MAG: transposase [Deltaproteobacteria bacterium HGW-Deltaproteobacteria-13]